MFVTCKPFFPGLVALSPTSLHWKRHIKENKDNNNKQNYLVESSPGTTRSSGLAILYKPHFVVKKYSVMIMVDFLLQNLAMKW